MSPTPLHQDESLESLVALVVDEFRERQRQGEQPDVEEYAERYPQAAKLLRKVLASWQLMGLSGAGGSVASGAVPEEHVSGLLGDFRIVQEVGRGGMAVVYEAEQISLGRRVALKVLPLAATMDLRHLQRFHNEARAAAGLHHQNIVPVFYVGCERGVHFYAMQFIHGQTLASILRDLRQGSEQHAARGAGAAVAAVPAGAEEATVPHVPARPGPARPAETMVDAALSTERSSNRQAYFRTVARLGVQAAEALDYAHERGVVHRDVKPGNLMLDGDGNLWVTDFGLAHLQHAEGSLTMTGDLVGTLRYMSPEQALAKRVVIDHRTDVYSLGATLYELLTLRPACDGKDRQELLRQVAFEEPVPPRKLDRSIPAELETIVLKAIEKNPADRYPTAQELADDLRRWLEDRPIYARRPSLRQVTVKWVRRHKAAARAMAVVLLVVAILGGANGLWWVQKRAGAEAQAREGLQEARLLLKEEKWTEALSAVRRAKAVIAGVWADTSLLEQAKEMEKDLEMARRLEAARLVGMAGKDDDFDLEGEEAAFAETFQWYGLDVDNVNPTAATERLRSCSIRIQLAAALDHWALLRLMLKVDSWQQPVAIARLADPDPWRNRFRDSLRRRDPKGLEALIASVRGDDLTPTTAVFLVKISRGSPTAERSLLLLRQVQQRYPADFWVNHELGSSFQQMKPPLLEEAIRYHTAAVAARPLSPGLHVELGNALQRKGLLDEAIATYCQAIRLKKDFYKAFLNCGIALMKKGRLDEAVEACRKAIQLKKADPHSHCALGEALELKGQRDAAIDAFREAIRLKPNFANAHYNLGRTLRRKGAWKEAIDALQTAVHHAPSQSNAWLLLAETFRSVRAFDDALAACDAVLRHEPERAEVHLVRGNTLKDKGELDLAVTAYRKAIELKPSYAPAHNNLGVALLRKALLADSVSRKALLVDAVAEYRKAIRYDKDYVEAHYNLGSALMETGQADEAVDALRQAIKLNENYAEAHCNLGLVLRGKGQFRQAVEELRRGHQLGSRKPNWRYPSEQWLAEAEECVRIDDRLSAVLQGKGQPKDSREGLVFADMCIRFRKQYVAAAHFYQETFADPSLAEDLKARQRYNASRAAALAGSGKGQDAAGLSPMQRLHWRRQALTWLYADLRAWQQALTREPTRAGPAITRMMKHWLADPDFKDVRGQEALAKLPEVERPAWQKLWADVADMRARAQKTIAPDKKPSTK